MPPMTREPVTPFAVAMDESGVSGVYLAGKIGVSKQTITKLRNGHQRMTLFYARKLAPLVGREWFELIPAGERDGLEASSAGETVDDVHKLAIDAIWPLLGSDAHRRTFEFVMHLYAESRTPPASDAA